MRLHQKLLLAILPAVLAVIVGFGAWAYRTAYEVVEGRALATVDWMAERFMHDELESRLDGETDALVHQVRQADAQAAVPEAARVGARALVLLDAQGQTLRASTPALTGEAGRWSALLSAQPLPRGSGRYAESDSRVWLYGLRRFEPWQWTVLVLEPADALSAALARIRWVAVWTACGTAALVIGLVLWVSRELLIRPILALRSAAASIARAPAHVRIAVRSGDELDELARAMENMAATLSDEIARREAADLQLERLKNLYAALGETNQALVRIHDRAELRHALCRIAVEHGHFILAWVGELDNATGWLIPAAVAGPAAPLVGRIRVSVLSSVPEGLGVTGRAFRGEGWAVENDFLGNPAMRPWQAVAAEFGIGSAAAFALYEETELTAILLVYAGEAGFFRPDLVALLRSLAADISFALSALRRAEARERAEAAQHEAEERLHSALEASGDGIWELELASGHLIATSRCLEMLGYAPGEIGATLSDWNALLHPDDRRDSEDAIEAHVRGETAQFLHEHRLRCADGQYRWVRSAGRVMRRDAEGRPLRMFGTQHDINDRKAAEERILFLGYRDVLTGLPNRVLFADRLTQALVHARRSGRRVAVMFLDLDRFKAINDTLGHGVGDELLCAVGVRLRASVREADTVCRRGGDEFVVAIEDVESLATVGHVAAKILERLSEPYELAGRQLHIGVSLGVALFPDDGVEPETLIRHADTAMYAAKEAGRGNVQFFTASMHTQAERRMSLESALRRALAEGLLTIELQPQLALASGRVLRVEARLACTEPLLAQSACADLVAIAVECGLAEALDDWLLGAACRLQCGWDSADGTGPIVAVKLAAERLRGAEQSRRVAEALVETGVDAGRLEIEFAEALVMREAAATESNLRALKRMGVHIAIADFGSGYSSLGYLKRFPIDRLKIDASFIRDLPDDHSSAELTRAIVAMAHALHIEVVAEGVESAAQHALLAAIGCDHLQGAWFAVPMLPAAFAAWLAARADASPSARRADGDAGEPRPSSSLGPELASGS